MNPEDSESFEIEVGDLRRFMKAVGKDQDPAFHIIT
jgi:hypothetical protein